MQTEGTPVNLRILAIDDEYLIALDVQYVLAEYSWCHVDVETTTNFHAALSSGARYDVVIIDPDTVDLSRCELASQIKSTGATVIWSSLDNPGSDTDALDSENNIVTLRKPFSARQLLQSIRDALTPVQPDIARAVAALL